MASPDTAARIGVLQGWIGFVGGLTSTYEEDGKIGAQIGS
jgi:hypothetical protein